jgi:hypothetical protein
MLDEPDPLDFDEYLERMDDERKKYLEEVALSLRAKIELETAKTYFGQGFRKGFLTGSLNTIALTFVAIAVYYVIVKYWS